MGKGQARYLRNNSTLPEVLLWNRLKHDQIRFQFRRQYELGKYILDLYCPDLNFAIEIDGKIHESKEERDAARDAYLASEYVIVMRIPARSVLHDSFAVAMQIQEACVKLQSGENPFHD